jgi:HK97 family phage portal protein
MSIWERFIQALARAFSSKEAYVHTNTWDVGQPVYPLANFETNVRYGFRKNELIYACVALKADSAAIPTLRVYRRSDGTELPDHPCRALIQRPNPFMTEFDWVSITLMLLDLAGRAYWEKQRSRSGAVVGLWPLRPDWVQPIVSATGLPGGYQYAPPGVSSPITLDARDVLEFKLWDPLNLYQGMPPVSVAARIGDVDNAITDYLKKFFEQGGIPPGLLSSKLKLTDAQVTDIRRRWRERYGGWQNWTDPVILDSDASYQKTGSSFEEMGFDVLDARDEARICSILRVPPILVGTKVGLSNATYSNYEQARKAWWQDDLSPQYKRIADECQNDLASEFGDDIELRWDFSAVPALQEDRNVVYERARAALAGGGITVNEYRQAIGLPRVVGGDVFIRTLTMVEQPATPERGRKSLPGGTDERAQTPGDPPDLAARRRAEGELQQALEGYFSAQRKRIEKAVSA